MAEGWARHFYGDRYEIFSAGSHPAGVVNASAIQVMKEKGIDISSHTSKGIPQIQNNKYEAVVSMGCGDACPQIPTKHRIDWDIPDPVGKPVKAFIEVRDRLEKEIRDLFENLDKLQ